MVKRTYDELSNDEKDRFTVMNLWMHNQIIYLSWFVGALLILMGVIFIIVSLGGFETVIYQIYLFLATLIFAVFFFLKVKKINKLSQLIFGVSNELYTDFFGIEEKDVEVTLKELLHDFEKTQIKGVEKHACDETKTNSRFF